MGTRVHFSGMRTEVFFFGGFNAQWDHILQWLVSAKLQKPTIDFSGFPWPDGVVSAPDTKVVKGSEKLIKEAVTAIEASRAEVIYIVGHSMLGGYCQCRGQAHQARQNRRARPRSLTVLPPTTTSSNG